MMLSCTPNHRGSRLHPNSNRSLPAKTCFTNNETILYGTHPTNDISHQLAKLPVNTTWRCKPYCILQLLYFVLRFGLTSIFHTRCISDPKAERIFISYSNGEILLKIALLMGLSWGMGRYILQSDRMVRTTLWSGMSLFLLFEASKYMEYWLGYLPTYFDAPVLGLLFSFLAVCIYMGMLYVTCLLWKRIRTQK